MRPFRFFLVALAFALASAAAAPLAHAQLIPSFGVTGGLNFGSLSDAAGADLDQSTGYHVGVFGDFGFGPLAARASVIYVRVGDIELPLFNDPSVTYISVPVDLQYRLPSPLLKPYALFGPEARFAVGDLTDLEAESVAFAVNLGIGAELAALIGPKVFAELRYAFDVTGFAPGEAGDLADEDFKVNVFFLRVGVGL